MRKIPIALLCTFAFFAALAAPARAEAPYPSRTITLVVPLAAGSTTDVAARLIAKRAGQTLGQQIVVENRTGAGITLGSASVAKAPPDGYTILISTVGLAVDHILKKVPYDTERDFAPISVLITAPMILLVNPALGVTTVREFIDKYKDSQEVTFSSGGAGTLPHLSGELFKAKTGIAMRHVPYRGGGPALNDVIAGHIHFNFGTPLTKPYIDAGQVRALAVAAPQRIHTLPDVPTFAEAGLPMPEIEGGAWFALLAPAGTPKEIVDTLHRHFADALKDPEVREGLDKLGLVSQGSTPEAFARFLHEEILRWPPIFSRAGLGMQQ
jgi:tripartite-type tricarboxylate transporter receptor subunit TctC